jgi:hypothetical protein
MWCWPTST